MGESEGQLKSMDKAKGKPEFHIRIHSRQNNSIQGSLHWLNTSEKVNFRSLFELVSLIQQATDASLEPGLENLFRSWKMDGEFGAQLPEKVSSR